MDLNFKHWSDELGIELIIEIEVYASNEDDCEVSSLVVYDDKDEELDFSKLPDKDKKRIDKAAEDLAYENAYEAYQDRMIGQADAAHDAWKDSQE